jgi:hypothetical protein
MSTSATTRPLTEIVADAVAATAGKPTLAELRARDRVVGYFAPIALLKASWPTAKGAATPEPAAQLQQVASVAELELAALGTHGLLPLYYGTKKVGYFLSPARAQQLLPQLRPGRLPRAAAR